MIYYAFISILLAAVDAFRIRWKNKRVKHPVGNNDISHAVSVILAIVSAICLWLVLYGVAITWAEIPFAVGCAAIRVIAYDPFLNLFRRLPIDTISGTSNSKTEKGWGKVPFWWRRFIGVSLLIIVLLVNHFLK